MELEPCGCGGEPSQVQSKQVIAHGNTFPVELLHQAGCSCLGSPAWRRGWVVSLPFRPQPSNPSCDRPTQPQRKCLQLKCFTVYLSVTGQVKLINKLKQGSRMSGKSILSPVDPSVETEVQSTTKHHQTSLV